MPIITQTSLKDLKYGNDQPGGGNSGQPYVTSKEGTKINVFTATGRDIVRIGKFLKDPPKGPLFILKQVGLQLSNPKLETRTDLLGKLMGSIGSTRIYNLGINTLAQVAVSGFGGHIVRHGLLPIIDERQKYEKVVAANNAPGTFGKNNRLIKLKARLEADPNANISRYIGGPGSLLGLGTTTIRRYVNTFEPKQETERTIEPIDYWRAQGLSEQYFDQQQIIESNHIISGSLNSPPKQIDQNVMDYKGAKTYDALKKAIDIQTENARTGTSSPNITTNPTGPVTFTFSGRSRYKNLPLKDVNIANRLGYDTQDQINLTPLFISDASPEDIVQIKDGKPFKVKDLIKFRIEAVDGDQPSFSTWMIFRAYLTNINDSPNPSWDSFYYIGRGEPFYIYRGFERTISFNFQVAALSEAEMKPMWQKLNYLYSNTMPDYKDKVMRAPYIRLTIGDYIFRQPGIIRSLTYSVDNKAPWEIALEGGDMYQLPHVLDVQMTFAPIHDFLPRKFPKTLDGSLPAFIGNQKLMENIFTDNKMPTV